MVLLVDVSFYFLFAIYIVFLISVDGETAKLKQESSVWRQGKISMKRKASMQLTPCYTRIGKSKLSVGGSMVGMEGRRN